MSKRNFRNEYREHLGSERVFAAIGDERIRQIQKWGPQHHPDGTGALGYAAHAGFYKSWNDTAEAAGIEAVWSDILLEELFEALAEKDQALLRAELVQVAAVAVAWIEDIDGRSGGSADGRS